MSAARHAYHALLAMGALSVASLAAMLLVGGGWQAVAAFALLVFGFGFLCSFIALVAMAEQPSLRRPAVAPGSRPVTAPSPSPAPEPERVREPLVSPEPIWSS